jgi:TRAP-type C4-dicarboxylate transport system substrate-binding protein
MKTKTIKMQTEGGLKMTRKTWLIILLICAIVSGGLSGTATAKKINWKWQFNASGIETMSTAARYVEEVIPNVAKRTNGNFIITPYWWKDLGLSPTNYPKALASGMIDMAWVFPGYFGNDVPTVQVCNLWMMYRTFADYKIASNIAKPYHQMAYDKAYRETVKLVAVGPYNWVVMVTKKPFPSVTDWSGIKIRVPDDASQRFLKAMGATGVIIPYAEIVPATHQGLVDGVATSLDELTNMKFYEMCNNLYLFNMLSSEHHALVSSKSLANLPEEYREILMDELRKAEAKTWDVVIGENPTYNNAVKVWEDYGANIYKLNDADFKYVQNKMKPAWKIQTDKFKEIAPDLLEKVYNALGIK